MKNKFKTKSIISKAKSYIIKLIPLLLVLAINSLLFATSINSAQAASSSFSTSGGGKVNVGQNISVTVSVNGSESYNAIEVNVNFSNLTFLSATPTGGWTTFSGPTRSGNSISYVGALFGSSTTGTKSVLNLSFRAPASAGIATVSASGSISITNGNSKVSGGGNTATFTVSIPPAAPTATPTPKPGPNAVNITSSTHPSSDQWYKIKDPIFSWNKQDGVSDFSYSMDNKSDTAPDEVSEGADISKIFQNIGEGTSYLHIKAKNEVGWGPTSHYQINIDLTAPEPFTITKSEDPATNEYILFFATNDISAGIGKYTLSVDGQDKGDQKSGARVNVDAANIVVTAIDQAGNSTQSSIDTKKAPVEVSQSPTSTNAPQSVETQPGAKSSEVNFVEIALGIAMFISLTYSCVLTYLYLKSIGLKKAIESKKTPQA